MKVQNEGSKGRFKRKVQKEGSKGRFKRKVQKETLVSFKIELFFCIFTKGIKKKLFK